MTVEYKPYPEHLYHPPKAQETLKEKGGKQCIRAARRGAVQHCLSGAPEFSASVTTCMRPTEERAHRHSIMEVGVGKRPWPFVHL